MNLKEQRAATLRAANGIVDRAKAENRDLTPDETAEVERMVEAIKQADETAERQAKGAELLRLIGGVAPDQETPGGIDGRSGSYGQPKAGHVSFKGLGASMAASMVGVSRQVSPFVKGLVPAGESVLPLPVVNTSPFDEGTPPRLVDVLPLIVRQAPTYRFLRQSVVPDSGGASVVAPGDVKSVLKLGVEPVDARLKVVAVLSEPVDKYILEDASSLQTWVGVELADALQTALELEVLSGDGTGEHFTGLAHVSGTQVQTFAADRLVTVQSGLSKLEATGITPAFVAMSAPDWLGIQTTRNASGSFDVGGPIDTTARTVWGTRVVVVPGLTAGTAWLVGEDTLTLSTDTQGVRVEWGTPGDNFQRNQVTARCEGRFNLDVMKPRGLVKLGLSAT
jgi:hypothetical protein